jgi:predicted AlkP superfamily phosphohydrolase/phosphomutase
MGPRRRLFVFGWDAADWAVVEAGWREGRLENLRAVAERGQMGTVLSTIPAITPPAFTSFITGADPGEHGIFGFVARGEGYEYFPVPGGARKVPTLIRRLDQTGYRTALVTFPYTYPAEKLERGVVVPGWDDPEETFDSVHPPEAGRALAQVVSKVPRQMNLRAVESLIQEKMREHVDLRERIARWVAGRADPEVFAMVYSETDHAAHRWWLEGDPPRELIDVYELVDASMGRLIKELVRDEDTVLVVSDHGSWPIHHLVHLSPLLAEGGFLTPARRTGGAAAPEPEGSRRRGPAARLNANESGRQRSISTRLDWANTRAFPLGDHVIATGIYVNAPPFPAPAVSADEYEDVRSKVAALLAQVEDPQTGEPAFATVARREDVYSGPATPLAPDLVLEGIPGCSPHVGRILNFRDPFTEVRVGGHRREGIYAASAPLGLDQVEPIDRILPKVLEALAFDVAERGGAASEGYSDEQAAEIEQRLRGLGYME